MLAKIWDTIPDLKTLGVAKLYENFINLCYEKYTEKTNLNKVTNVAIHEDVEDKYKSLHKKLALLAIFGRKFLFENKIITEDEIAKVIDDFKRYNFSELTVSLDDETPIFVHKTYAEYLAAVRIIEEKDEIRIKLYEVLFKQEFQLVRLMFDRIAAKDNPLHLAVLEEDFGKVQALCSDLSLSRDAFNRSPLHLALGYSNKTHEKTVRLKIADELAIHCKNNELIYQLSDGLLKLNFYEHAIKSGNRKLFFYAAYLGAANILELIARLDSTCVNQQYIGGETALHLAAVNGKDECVRCLFEMGADVSLRNEDGLAAVQIAAQAGHLSVLELLYKKGVDINLDYSTGLTPLDYALSKEHKKCADFLIEAGAHTSGITMYLAATAGYIEILRHLIVKDVEAKYVNGKIPLVSRSPLHTASCRGNVECVNLLIEKGAEVNVQDRMNYTPLHCAASRGHMNILTKLKEAKANVNSLSIMNETPLHVALQCRYEKSALNLIENGADINLEDGNGMTPLHYAAQNGYEDLLKLLVDKSADINVGSVTEYTALHSALGSRHEECAKYLIEKGAQIKKTTYNFSPVHAAASSGYIQILKLLSERGVDIVESESETKTALHFASESGQLEIVKYLLESGAQVNQKCENGRTPLHGAANSRNPEVINFLKQENANLSEADCRGWTPLHYATRTREEYVPSVKCLITSETINRATEDGHTPLHYAAQRGHSEVIRELLKANANTEARNFKNQKPLDLVRKDDVKCIEILKSYGPESFDVQKLQKEKSKLRELGFCLQESEENEIVKALVTNAFDDLNVENILHIAAEKGYLHVLKQLAERGVEVDCIDKFQRTALFLAARMGHLSCVSFILDQGANVNFTTFHYTPLLIASEFGHLDVVKVLINKGACITPTRETIRLILESEHLDVLKYFLEENVYEPKEFMSDYGEYALTLAAQIGHFESVSYFLNKNIDVNRGINGGTPLHHAAFFGHLSILKLLIKKDAKLDILNFEGQTAEEIAIKRGHTNCAKYLKSKMDKIKLKLSSFNK